MRVSPVSSIIYKFFLVFGLLLTGCTERAMQIEFLAKNILSSYEFKATNAINDTDIPPANDVVPFQVECSKSVIDAEVFDTSTQSFKKLKELDTNATFDCVENQTASFSLTYSQVGAVANPVAAGDQRRNIQVRLTVKNLTGEVNTYQKNFSAFFAAPAVTILTASNINASSGTGAAGTSYNVTGTCDVRSGHVTVSIPFATAQTVSCSASGTYTADLVTTAALTDGTVTLSVKHASGAPYYAYGSASKDIVIDRTLPALSITSPTSSGYVTSADVTNGKYSVSGTCETGLTVTVTSNPTASATTSCVNGAFTALMDVVQGSVNLTASQTDSAGNVGSSSRTIGVDTIGPDAFTISGIRSSNTDSFSDLSVDNILTDTLPQIHYTAAAGADNGYEIKIRQVGSSGALGAEVCSQTASNVGTSVNMTNCTLAMLTQGATYQIYIVANDPHGNKTSASNDGYQFTVNYPLPRLTNNLTFTNIAAGVYAPLDTEIGIDLVFDRPVRITSGTPYIVLNTVSGGRTIAMTSLNGTNKRTIRFTYKVAAGEFATPLNFKTLAITGNIVDDRTGISANLTIPSGLVVAGTNAFNVDTVAPPSVTNLSLSSVRPFYNESPIINFTVPADINGSALTVRVVITGSNTNATFGAVSSGTRMTGLNLDRGSLYTVNVYTIDPAGNLSTAATSTFTSFACPNNFLYVYDATYAPTPFCIAPVEARGPVTAVRFDSGSYTTAPIEASYNQATQTGSGCKSLSPAANYDLPTHAEWNAVANIIASRGDNWMRGTVGGSLTTNYVYLGVTGASSGSGEPIVVGSPCYPGTCGSTPDRRVHYLPAIGSGALQELWDFSGNMYELQKGADTTRYETLNYSVGNPIAGLLQNTHGGTQSCSVLSPNIFPYYCGFGSINFNCSELSNVAACSGTQTTVAYPYILRGGSKTSSRSYSPEGNQQVNNAGIFASYRMTDSSSVPALQGFRCVYHP
ncbi:hypothetical protein AZI86_15680 [Bdellovibrio bacteriovorus]|uniref:Uncharacterized protein n=1 Tax=Bdellovibrio bacteriovorus TaxID=959 RepID=A0A150WHX8_BDEBC|nr:hypothetical protein [Bdellovibrio bacteriovorus]KYG63147.1 hypothetical protein AZI86_15680 [Bdellovibrio bacteriovorus]